MQERKRVDIEVLEAGAGYGKTYSVLHWVVNEEIPKGNTQWVYVGRNKQLCNESYKLCTDLDSGLNASLIHGDNKTNLLVNTDIIEYLESEGGFDILFITHCSFLYLVDKGYSDLFNDCNVLVDENLDIFDYCCVSVTKEDDHLMDFMELDGVTGEWCCTKSKKELRTFKKSDKYSDRYKKLLSCLAERYFCYVDTESETNNNYMSYHIVDIYQAVEGSKRFILMGAKLIDTFTSGLLSHLCIDMVSFTDVILSRVAYHNQQRVRIYPLTSTSKVGGCTSSLLNGYTNKDLTRFKSVKKYNKDRHSECLAEYRPVFDVYCELAHSVLGEDFIYTTNLAGKDEYKPVVVDGREIGVSVPYAVHGRNDLQHHSKALGLYSYKPCNELKRLFDLLAEGINFTDIANKYVEDKMRESCLQLLTRTCIRDFSDHDTPLTFVVVDYDVANYIKDNHIQGCIIDGSIAIDIPHGNTGNTPHNKTEWVEKVGLKDKSLSAFHSWKTYQTRKKGKVLVESDYDAWYARHLRKKQKERGITNE